MTVTSTRLTAAVIAPDGDDYRLSLTFADGATVETLVSFEQLDDLAEEIDRQLDTDDD